MGFVKGLIDGTKTPGQRPLEAFIAPPDPNTAQGPPTAYVWSSKGNVRRQSGPRSKPPQNNQGQYTPQLPAGWKIQAHSLSIWLVWFNDNSDPRADVAFPAVIDIVMMVLQTCQMPANITDPLTGWATQLIDLGKNMDWDYRPVRAVAGQRYQRFDAEITAPVEEWLQA